MARPILAELTIASDPVAWRRAGFDVSADGIAEVGGVRLRFDGEGGGISGWALGGVEHGDLDGLTTTAGAAPNGPAHAHPNGVASIDHVVVMTPALERTLAALEAAGFDLRRVREAGEMRQAFYRLDGAILEVVGPVEPDGPARFWGLVFVVADIDRTAALLGPALGGVKDAVQPGRRIATVRESAGLGLPVALITPHLQQK